LRADQAFDLVGLASGLLAVAALAYLAYLLLSWCD